MQLNQIFKIEQYSEAFEYISQNGYTIKEIEKDINGNRQFQIVEIPKPSQKQLAEQEIQRLKDLLSSTDYKAIKYAEGLFTEEEYAETKALRQSWRDKINELEKIL